MDNLRYQPPRARVSGTSFGQARPRLVDVAVAILGTATVLMIVMDAWRLSASAPGDSRTISIGLAVVWNAFHAFGVLLIFRGVRWARTAVLIMWIGSLIAGSYSYYVVTQTLPDGVTVGLDWTMLTLLITVLLLRAAALATLFTPGASAWLRQARG
jgi:hypothetical protein